VNLNRNSIGQVNGQFDLTGKGNSVGSLLASSNGKLGLVVAGGEVSKLMMEKIGLHLWEILSLNLTGDRLVKLRCAVADFDVKQGRMTASALVFDTQVTTLIGTGTIDLGHETLDLTLNPRTKKTSPLALTSPIYIRGSFAQPDDRSRQGACGPACPWRGRAGPDQPAAGADPADRCRPRRGQRLRRAGARGAGLAACTWRARESPEKDSEL
jgi:uncharacterized protein involved in outer membrane biogenesis